MLKKIKENKFFTSAFILLFGGFISKFLGFVIRIIITRILGTEGIGLYSLLAPTMSLLTVIAVFSYPIAISKLIAIKGKSAKKIIFSIIPISLLINIIFICFLFLFSPILSTYLLKESRLYYPIICIGLIMPFIGLSSIIKGYFWGKQKMFPYILSNIVEQIVRLIILIIILPRILNNLILCICIIILVNIISETISIVVMILGLPKGVKITKEDIKINKNEIKDIMNISVPVTSSKILGSIAYFLEPIILTNVLLYVGYSSEFILTEYGIINGYALSLLLLPQFFTISVSTALVPELSKKYSQNDLKGCIKRIKQIIFISLLIGLISTIIIYIFPEFLLKLIFSTIEGAIYIRILAPFTLLYFIEIPLINSLQALGKAKETMVVTLISSLVKLISIFVFSLLKIKMYGLVISIILGLFTTTYFNYKSIKKVLS